MKNKKQQIPGKLHNLQVQKTLSF